jgi:hypothetical protein
LIEHHFPEGESRKRITTTAGLPTEPDWLYEPSKVAVYLDGMSRTLHGDPKTAKLDQLIRQMLELDGYTVIVVQSRDLNDPQAVRQHLKNIAQAIGRTDLPLPPLPPGDAAPLEPAASEMDASSLEVDQLLTYCDEQCRPLLKAWALKSKSLPTLGFELADGDGTVAAQAELAWPAKKVAVVLPDQLDDASAFNGQGWTVLAPIDLDDPERVAKLLGE